MLSYIYEEVDLDQKKGLTANALKLIAVVAMLIDHMAWWLLPMESLSGELLHTLGRITAPIMCYFISEGYFHTKNLRKYLIRLLLFAFVSHFAHAFFFGYGLFETTGILWGMALGLVSLMVYKSEKMHEIIKILIIISCCILAYPADLSSITVLWILFFGIFHGQFKKQMLSFLVIGATCLIIPAILPLGWEYIYLSGIVLAVPLLAVYNKERGIRSKFMKWGFYVFYPLHLFILGILRYYIFK